MYGLYPRMLSALIHRNIVDAFKGTISLMTPVLGSSWNVSLSFIEVFNVCLFKQTTDGDNFIKLNVFI
jgi:hypothetical protein